MRAAYATRTRMRSPASFFLLTPWASKSRRHDASHFIRGGVPTSDRSTIHSRSWHPTKGPAFPWTCRGSVWIRRPERSRDAGERTKAADFGDSRCLSSYRPPDCVADIVHHEERAAL